MRGAAAPHRSMSGGTNRMRARGSGGKWRPREEPPVHAGGSNEEEDFNTDVIGFLMRLRRSK